MKRIISFFLTLLMLLTFCPYPLKAAEISKELNIYAIYLESDKKGESVLLESQGQYLLIDIGSSKQVPVVIRQLNKLGVTHVDILFSHLHNDHIGGTAANPASGLYQLAAAGITVDTLYLPSPTLAPLSINYPARYTAIQNFMIAQGQGQTVYLNVGATLRVGDADGVVIGPVNTSQLSPSQYVNLATEKDRYVRYENNCSLAVIFTCGETRYFTAGDCYKDETAYLLERYGDSLCSDIMKLCHHGTGSGNSAELMATVSPSYSFASNTGLAYVNQSTDKWVTYTSAHRASKYGMCYLLGNEKQTVIYHIVDNQITIYQGSTIPDGRKMSGWQSLYGADGVNRDHDLYYLDSYGVPVKGVQKLDGKYFYFSDGGQMELGKFYANGTYNGWKTYEGGERYYVLSDDKAYAYMARGITNIEGSYFYFDSDGYKVTNGTLGERKVVTIDSADYLMDSDGELLHDVWEEKGNTWLYFGTNGKMHKNQVRKVDGSYYIFSKDGTVVTSASGVSLYQFGSNMYVIRTDGTLVTKQCKTVKGNKYYLNQKGVVQKNKLIKIGSKTYYFGKDGKMVCNQKIKLNGKKYYCNKKGIVSEIKK